MSAEVGVATGIIAGIFPSLYLTSLKPSLVLKGKFLQGSKGSLLREGFTLFQFFASMILITCSIIIYNQLNYMQHKDLGFDQEEVIVLPIKNLDAINPKFEEIRNELLRIPNVKSVSAASNVPGRPFNQNPVFATQSSLKSSPSLPFVFDIALWRCSEKFLMAVGVHLPLPAHATPIDAHRSGTVPTS